LGSAKKRGIPIASERVLAKYQRQRRGDNLAMIAITQGFKVLFGAKQLPIRWLRNEGMRRVNSLSRLRQAIIARAVKPLNL
jgi:2-octaprenylphenol hydroxylase